MNTLLVHPDHQQALFDAICGAITDTVEFICTGCGAPVSFTAETFPSKDYYHDCGALLITWIKPMPANESELQAWKNGGE